MQAEYYDNLMDEAYALDNYLIEEMPIKEDDEKWAAVYFTGGGLYAPDAWLDFYNKFIKNNRFGFYKNRLEKASKHIFLRDTLISAYKNGINSTINSPEKLVDFVRKETEGYKVVLTGSSSGGSIATYIGCKLNAEYVIAFSPAYCYRKDTKPDDFIETLKSSNTQIYYTQPIYSKGDVEDYDFLNNHKNIKRLSIKSTVHPIAIATPIIPLIINSNRKMLDTIFDNHAHVAISYQMLAKKYFGKEAYRQVKLHIFYYLTKAIVKEIMNFPTGYKQRAYYRGIYYTLKECGLYINTVLKK